MEALDLCYSRNPALVFRKIGGECLLVPVFQNVADMDGLYVLNEVGSRIWELLDGQNPVRRIRDIIVGEYEVNPQEAEADVWDFLEQIKQIQGVNQV